MSHSYDSVTLDTITAESMMNWLKANIGYSVKEMHRSYVANSSTWITVDLYTDTNNTAWGYMCFRDDTAYKFAYFKDGADSVTPFSKRAVVFTSSPVDMKQYTNEWAKLTASDFKVGITSATAKGEVDTSDGSGKGHWSSYSGNTSISYNNTTGQLTFSAPSGKDHRDRYVFAQLSTSGLFAVWLGTVNGK